MACNKKKHLLFSKDRDEYLLAGTAHPLAPSVHHESLTESNREQLPTVRIVSLIRCIHYKLQLESSF